ncbi:MAG: penicillin-binding protein 2 [Nitriliruptorales bacterium]|nr:penicillin-binding protein 2 [Nitriliruptorales bacterium]
MSAQEPATGLRLTFLAVVVGIMFLALFSRLWFLQVLAGERYEALAESNRVRPVVIEAPRGRILDRAGQELVKNRPALTVSGDRRLLLDGAGNPRDEHAEEVLANLEVVLDMSREDIVERLTSRKYSPFRPIPIKEDVEADVVLFINEHREHFRGVVTDTLPVRTYPEGTTAAHLLGYVREISPEELDARETLGYRLGDLFGVAGLEAVYEDWLRGEHGLRTYEVNANNVVQRPLANDPPVRGNDLQTTLDLDLQQDVERILLEGLRASRDEIHRASGSNLKSQAGSAIVLDPRNGEVLAMASYPTYDPSVFVGGLSQQDFNYVFDRENAYHKPALNRAIQGEYAPGSTFKIATGLGALRSGQITTSSTVNCPAVWGWGKRNWNSYSEGRMDLSRALMRSCDTFFYELVYNHWLKEERQEADEEQIDEIYQETARLYGFDSPLGIDLPDEKAGRIPDREWKQAFWELTRDQNCTKAEEAAPGTYARQLYSELCNEGFVWRGGDAVNMSIGQGDVLTTPLQIVAAYMAVANGGTVWTPHLGRQVLSPEGEVIWTYDPEPTSEVPFEPEWLDEIRRGLEDVVMEPRGTAHGAFIRGEQPFPLDEITVAGKTGTAEVGGKLPSAWFATYAPADDPRYVVVVSVEEGGGGSQTGAPIARRILEAAFDLPITPFENQLPAATD